MKTHDVDCYINQSAENAGVAFVREPMKEFFEKKNIYNNV